MPFYEYECPHCGHHDEVLQKISEAPLKKCPNCGKNGLRKLMSAPVFRLKGSGWYETDFKSDKENKRNLAGADKEEAEKKADSKPDAKAGGASRRASRRPPRTTAKPAADKPAAKPVDACKSQGQAQGRRPGAPLMP